MAFEKIVLVSFVFFFVKHKINIGKSIYGSLFTFSGVAFLAINNDHNGSWQQ